MLSLQEHDQDVQLNVGRVGPDMPPIQNDSKVILLDLQHVTGPLVLVVDDVAAVPLPLLAPPGRG